MTPRSTHDSIVWLHKKSGGKYHILAFAHLEATLMPVVVYQGAKGGEVWVRPKDEFFERFVPYFAYTKESS